VGGGLRGGKGSRDEGVGVVQAGVNAAGAQSCGLDRPVTVVGQDYPLAQGVGSCRGVRGVGLGY